MGLIKNDRVNIVITDRFVRYSYNKNPSEPIGELGEIELPEGVIVKGNVKDEMVFQKVIERLVQSNRWKRKKLYFCVPDITVVIRELQTPTALSREEALAYVKTQLGRTIHFPFSNPMIAVDLLDEDKESRNLIVYAYPKDRLNVFEKVFKDVGLKPVVADLTTLSVYRYFYINELVEKENVLLVHWNGEGLTMTSFHNHKAIFLRHMSMNENLEEVVASNESMIEGMVRNYVTEIVRMIDFYQYSIMKGVSSIDLILLTGDFPYLSLVKNEISDATAIHINFHSNIAEFIDVKYLDVIGLAMKKVL